ncbi:MAG TPA: fluoride efflux transporter CrcB [Burkholderiales bacterium]|nr:fluoride efflux transporter CrcB [Burkholderiales bacterium]
MTFIGFCAVGVGAVLGAWTRWWLGMMLNPVFPTLPLGTLVANLTGALLMGLAMGLVAQFDALPPAVRLMFMTGFLGALTTFSTFSAEATTLIQREQIGWLAVHISVHLFGSLGATLLGIFLIRLLAKGHA